MPASGNRLATMRMTGVRKGKQTMGSMNALAAVSGTRLSKPSGAYSAVSCQAPRLDTTIGAVRVARLDFHAADASLCDIKRQLQVFKRLHLQAHVLQHKAGAPSWRMNGNSISISIYWNCRCTYTGSHKYFLSSKQAPQRRLHVTSTALYTSQCPVHTAPKADTQLLLLDIQEVSEVAGQQVA